MKSGSLILFLLVVMSLTGLSQTVPPLERTLTITFQGESIEMALSNMSKEGSFVFSYNPAILNFNQSVEGEFNNRSVREILNTLLGKSIDAKSKGNYIILTKATIPTRATVANQTVTISGYVTHAGSGDKIAEVSVYNKKTLAGVITDQYGYFKISMENPGDVAILNFSKRGFLDTLISLNPGTTQFLNIALLPEPPVLAEVVVKADTTLSESVDEPPVVDEYVPVRKRTLRDFLQEKVFSKNIFSRKKGVVNMANIKDTLYRDFQVSFVPFVGTNHKLSGNVINGYSLNVLGGYSMGTTKFEFGGLFNIDRADVKYGQVAGLFNTVGGNTNGVQFGGLGNITRREVNAYQFAGLFNANMGAVRGGQFAGLFNVNGRSSQGAQVAGLFNIQPGDYRGSQFAGLINLSTRQMKGSQISGLLNFAHHIQGTQIGVLNFADSIRGVPIGLMSFVSKGYHKLEFSADEIFYINASFRTGVRYFYNILAAGLKPESLDQSGNPAIVNPDQQNVWSFGYGIGTAPRISKRLFLNFDLTANHVNKGSFTNSISLLNKLYMGLDFQITRGFSITAGATLNAYLSDPTYADNPVLFTDFSPSIIREHNFSNGNNMKMWWGGKVGLRFF